VSCCTEYVNADAERKNSRSAKLEHELNWAKCCNPDKDGNFGLSVK